MNVLAITRAPKFSPQSVEKDARIMNLVLERLTPLASQIEIISEEDLSRKEGLGDADVVLNMARGGEAGRWIEAHCMADTILINAPLEKGGGNREKVLDALRQLGITTPKTVIYNAQKVNNPIQLTCPVWVKSANTTTENFPVIQVFSQEALENCIAASCKLGFNKIVLSEHVVGREYKFYGVAETDFWTTLPIISSKTIETKVKNIAKQLSNYLNVPVYGGDIIVSQTGEVYVLDFNEWPSFSVFCEEAAQTITELVERRWNQKQDEP